MFAKSIVALGFFSILAVAAPNPPESQCDTGAPQCCTAVGAASDSAVIAALGVLSGLLNGITVLVSTVPNNPSAALAMSLTDLSTLAAPPSLFERYGFSYRLCESSYRRAFSEVLIQRRDLGMSTPIM
ncbi:hypothetical protein BU17DRAFT_66063 [Hysterangium stoloniferum]|nr:hypothetical protein BU17DRAFT_66063 [Hysterangium stoloniferum]